MDAMNVALEAFWLATAAHIWQTAERALVDRLVAA